MNKPLDYIFPEPPEGLDVSQLNTDAIPEHIAVIMDGNGRWAKERGKNRLFGHRAGIEAVRETIRCASDLGVRYLTIYSFSSENWKRPQDEVIGLMNLFATTMLAEVDSLHKEGVRVMTIGRTQELPKKTQDAFAKAWEKTKKNDGMTLVVAVNYGGRQEILDAVNSLVRNQVAQQCAAKNMPACLDTASGAEGAYAQQAAAALAVPEVTEEMLAAELYGPAIPDPDLLIRTSGEMRVSNFLLWQIAYSEFVCTPVLWPDFNRYELLRSILEYQGRDRRFGAVK